MSGSDNGLVWEDPPESRAGAGLGSGWSGRILRLLQERPNTWAKIYEGPVTDRQTRTQATNKGQNLKTVALRHGVIVEAKFRSKDNVGRVYARVVSDGQQK